VTFGAYPISPQLRIHFAIIAKTGWRPHESDEPEKSGKDEKNNIFARFSGCDASGKRRSITPAGKIFFGSVEFGTEIALR
jgi:hypothetical protein